MSFRGAASQDSCDIRSSGLSSLTNTVMQDPNSPTAKKAFTFSGTMGHATFLTKIMKKIDLQTDFPEDADLSSDRMPCEIYLAIREIINSTAHHWALVFKFEDGEIRTYEALNDKGYLIPRWNHGPPTNEFEWISKNLGMRQLSRHEVNRKAYENVLSGMRYLIMTINCQTWVTVLLRNIGIPYFTCWEVLSLFLPIVGPVNLFYALQEKLNDKLIGSTRAIEGSTRAIEGSTRAIEGSTRAIEGSTRATEGSTQAIEEHDRQVLDPKVMIDGTNQEQEEYVKQLSAKIKNSIEDNTENQMKLLTDPEDFITSLHKGD